MVSPDINLQRLNDLEAMEFWIGIHTWELEETIKGMEEENEEDL